jgi:predicted kinase
MPSLIVLRGLPGCGKTTYAETLVAEDWLRFNRDSLRQMISFSEFKRFKEDMIVYMMKHGITEALVRGHDVVVDNIHLDPAHLKIVYDCYATATFIRVDNGQCEKIYYEVKEFPIDIDQCIENDLKRKRGAGRVGEKVIRKLYDQWIVDGKYVQSAAQNGVY